jgi:hypothetical protein
VQVTVSSKTTPCSAEFRKYLTEIPVLAAVATTVLVLWIDRHLASAPGVEDKR